MKNQNNIEKRLEQIELQVCCSWWDNLLFFLIIVSMLLFRNFFLTCLIASIGFLIIQHYESLNKKEIKKKYATNKQAEKRV